MSARLTRGLREGGAWLAALAVVLSAHVAAAAWVLQHDATGAPEGPAQPVFVDLVPPAPAPEPTASPSPAQGAPDPAPQPPVDTTPEAIAEQDPQPESTPAPEPEPTPEPEPEPEPAPEPKVLTAADLPDLQPLPPPLIPVEALSLASSARPVERPEQPRQRPAEPDPEPEPVRRAEPPSAPRPQPVQGQGGTAEAASRSGRASGSGGASAAQTASAINAWGAQIRTCISRRAAAPPGIRQGGRVVLSLTVARSGAIQAIGVAGSSGQPALDQAAVNAAQRAGRCPGAPAALDQASYSFQLPINLDVR